MRFACGFDHGGCALRETIFDALRGGRPRARSISVPSSSIPATTTRTSRSRSSGRCVAGDVERGILVCGSGAGVAVAATKVRGIRAAMAHDTYTAAQCVEHDNCNVLALGARVIGPEIASELATAFANAVFSGEERHVRRLAKVDVIERDGIDAQL